MGALNSCLWLVAYELWSVSYELWLPCYGLPLLYCELPLLYNELPLLYNQLPLLYNELPLTFGSFFYAILLVKFFKCLILWQLCEWWFLGVGVLLKSERK